MYFINYLLTTVICPFAGQAVSNYVIAVFFMY